MCPIPPTALFIISFQQATSSSVFFACFQKFWIEYYSSDTTDATAATVQACLESSEGEIEENDVIEALEEIVVEPLIERIEDEGCRTGGREIEGEIDSILV